MPPINDQRKPWQKPIEEVTPADLDEMRYLKGEFLLKINQQQAYLDEADIEAKIKKVKGIIQDANTDFDEAQKAVNKRIAEIDAELDQVLRDCCSDLLQELEELKAIRKENLAGKAKNKDMAKDAIIELQNARADAEGRIAEWQNTIKTIDNWVNITESLLAKREVTNGPQE